VKWNAHALLRYFNSHNNKLYLTSRCCGHVCKVCRVHVSVCHSHGLKMIHQQASFRDKLAYICCTFHQILKTHRNSLNLPISVFNAIERREKVLLTGGQHDVPNFRNPSASRLTSILSVTTIWKRTPVKLIPVNK
jgi:hypothetical protein